MGRVAGLALVVAASMASGPTLSSFEMDMTQGMLTLTWSQLVFPKSINASAVILQSNVSRGSRMHHLRLAGSVPQDANTNSTTFYLALTDDDYLQMLYRHEVAVSLASSYISMGAGVLRSVDGAASEPNHRGVLASSFTADSLKPILNSFSLDMDEGVLELRFNEPVNRTTFDPTGINLQQDSNQGYGGEYYILVRDGMSIIGGTEPVNRSLAFGETFAFNVTLGTTNLNAIKAKYPLCSTSSYTRLAVSVPIVEDYAGNLMTLSFRSIYSGIAPVIYTADTTRPELSSFSLDMDEGTITLYFSETVDVSSFDVTQVTLQQLSANTSESEYYTLRPTSYVGATDVADPTLTFSDWDINAIKLEPRLGVSVATTHLILTKATVTDVSKRRNVLVPIDARDAMQVSTFTADTTSPRLEWYKLDMNERILLMGFSEAVNVSTLLVEYITLQSSTTLGQDGPEVTLARARGTHAISKNSKRVRIALGDGDFNALKLAEGLADDISSVYVLLETLADGTSYAIGDMVAAPNTNRVVGIEDGAAQQAVNFTSDKSPPSLNHFELDLDTGVLSLTFDEPVQAASLVVTGLTLFSSRGLSVDEEYAEVQLTGQSTTSSVDGVTLEVDLSLADLAVIKLDERLAVSGYGDTFLAMEAASVYDLADYDDKTGELTANPIGATSHADALAVANYTKDRTPPTLTSYSLDMDAGELSLTFIEPVRASSLDARDIVLQNNVTETASRFSCTLTATTVTWSSNALTITLELGEPDVDALKLHSMLAKDLGTTFLRLVGTVGAIDDMAGNTLELNSTRNGAMAASAYTLDTTSPALASFDLSVPELCCDQLVAANYYSAEQCATLFGDEYPSSPSGANLTLRFDEPVDANSFDGAGVTLQAGETLVATTSLTLSSATTASPNGRDIVVTLAPSERATLASITSLGRTTSNTYVTLTSDTVRDLSVLHRNALSAIADGAAQQVGPVLRRFELDLDDGVLALFFSEAIDTVSYLDTSAISLMDTVTSETASEVFTFGTQYTSVVSAANDFGVNDSVVYFDFSTTDLPKLQLLTSTVRTSAAAYLRITSEFTRDVVYECNVGVLSANPVLAIGDDDALLPTRFTADTTRPRLVSSALDLDSGELSLTFSEPVRVASLDPSSITLQSSAHPNGTASDEAITLSVNTTTSSSDGDTLTLTLTAGGGRDGDLDQIKIMRYLAMWPSRTYIAMLSTAVSDCATGGDAQPLVPIPTSNATRVNTWTGDGTQPNLIAFDLDMNDAKLRLVFDEPVNATAFAVDQITIQSESTTASSSYTLSSESVLSPRAHSTVLHIEISKGDLDAMNEIAELTMTAESTFISITSDATADVFGWWEYNNTRAPLALKAIDSTNALAVRTFTTDTTSPNLNRYWIDMDAGKLKLEFDEVVDVGALDVTGIRLQYAKYLPTSGDEASEFLKLSNSSSYTTTTSDSTTLFVWLGDDDLNDLKARASTFVDLASSWLVLSTRTITDVFGNAVAELRNGRALQATNFTADTTRPRIISFTLYAAGTMTLRFDETIDWLSADPTQITMTTGTDSTSHFPLTSATTVSNTEYSLNLELDLTNGNNDFTNMQVEDTTTGRAEIGTSQTDSFMYLEALTITDMVGNPVVAVPASRALQMGPVISAFTLDMDEGELTLTFSEDVVGNRSIATESVSLQSYGENYTAAVIAARREFSALNESYAPRSFRDELTLTASSVARSPDGTEHKVVLSTHDFTALQLKRGLAVSERTTYLSTAYTTTPYLSSGVWSPRDPVSVSTDGTSVVGGTALAVVPIENVSALAITSFIGDTTRPTLTTYELDKVSALGSQGKRACFSLTRRLPLSRAGCGRPHAELFRGHRLLELQSHTRHAADVRGDRAGRRGVLAQHGLEGRRARRRHGRRRHGISHRLRREGLHGGRRARRRRVPDARQARRARHGAPREPDRADRRRLGARDRASHPGHDASAAHQLHARPRRRPAVSQLL